jgi:hypothetical protein
MVVAKRYHHLFQTTVQLVETCVNKLEIEINDEHVGNDIVIALDSTGIKVANREENGCGIYVARKKRLYEDTCVAVDIKKKKIVSLEVTSEEVHMIAKDVKEDVVDNASKNNDVVKRVLWLMVHMTVRQTFSIFMIMVYQSSY